MPRATNCLLSTHTISVEQALRMRDDPQRNRKVLLDFRCVACELPVRPHKDSKRSAAHFEHHRRNAGCLLSDPARR
jgi:hypothetical protein